MDNKKINKKAPFAFASVSDSYLEDNEMHSTEREVRGQKWVEFGTGNLYPSYLFGLYKDVPTLQTIINGICDYTVGDGVKSNIATMTDEDAERLVREMAMSYAIFGSISLNVLRNRMGTVAKVCTLDTRNVRSDENNQNFYYSKDFSNGKTYGRCKALVYPAFDAEDRSVASSIYYYKNGAYSTYGLPIWDSAVKCAETAKEIINFNFNAIKNGLSANVLISFCNGQPSDNVQEEIEELFDSKYTSSQNAGRPMLNWCQDKDHSIQIDKIDADSFSDRYTALQKTTEQAIYTAFRANPNLFGVNTENNGFSQEDFDGAYKLFSVTVIKPIQKIIINTINKIFRTDNAIEIKPFHIDFSEDATNAQTVE